MRVTTKGQVTIPKEVRDKLGITPGDEVGFREDGDAVILEKVTASADETPGERMVRLLAEFGRKYRDPADKRTTNEIMEDLRVYSEDADDPGFQRHS